MQLRRTKSKYSVLLTFRERTIGNILKKLRRLNVSSGFGRRITRKVYLHKKLPERVTFKMLGGYSKRYAKKVLREKGIKLPTEYVLGDVMPEEIPITPRNVLNYLIEIVKNFQSKTIDEMRKEEGYDIPENADEFPRLKAIEIFYVFPKSVMS